jgi:2-phosphosulfolactate phosphatase
MYQSLEVLFTPADFSTLADRDLRQTACVVFDVLRATSSMVTALFNGATAIIPVAEIPEALECKKRDTRVLLAGERDGLRIGADQTGGVEFDLGNSPREFVPERVRGRAVVMTTTNGTRALHACRKARLALAASFLNISATLAYLRTQEVARVLVVCSGTFEQAAYEDVLGAGAVCDALSELCVSSGIADSALMARSLYLAEAGDLLAGISRSRNGRRLLSRPELREDIAFCARRDVMSIVARLNTQGFVTRAS